MEKQTVGKRKPQNADLLVQAKDCIDMADYMLVHKVYFDGLRTALREAHKRINDEWGGDTSGLRLHLLLTCPHDGGARMTLARLIAEAEVLAGGEHQCAALGHVWKSAGGRVCPRGDPMGGGRCSQTVYVCASCDAEDYGEPGGPAYRECYTLGPCDPGCLQEPQESKL